jgi:hypothetical protein
VSKHRRDVEPVSLDLEFKQELRAFMHEEFSHFLSDIEFRVAQAYEVERRGQSASVGPQPVGKVYTEDLKIMKHMLTGYTVTDNTPTVGSIAWSGLHVVFNGVDHTVTNGSTTDRYIWWDPAQPTVLLTDDVKPPLAGDMALIFVNDGGNAIKALDSSMPAAVADGAVDRGAIVLGAVGTDQIADNAVTAAKAVFYADLVEDITAANNLATAAKNAADGAISTHYSAEPPWANNTSQPADKLGDLWYDTDTDQAHRWNGTTWQLIEDNNIAAALAAAADAQDTADGKITTYAAPIASPPTGTTDVPLSAGDMWIVTDQDDRIRRRNAANTGWDDISFGATAIADGAITPAKTTFYTALSNAVTAAQTDADNALTQVDLKISTHYATSFPWANASGQPISVDGDLFFRTTDDTTWRWQHSSQTWVQIQDSSISTALQAAEDAREVADGKINTYYNLSSNVPSAEAVGDLWVVQDLDNQVRRASAIGTGGWVSMAFGEDAIGDGAVTEDKIASGGVSASKLNIFKHILY